jgi:putative ABC transport system permease protein
MLKSKIFPFMWLGLHMAWRDIRAGIKHFRFFLMTLTLGVMLIGFIQSIDIGFSSSLMENRRDILGGDVSFTLVQHEANAEEINWLSSLGRITSIIDTRTMARADNKDPTLLELKVVDQNYPLSGQLITAPPLNADVFNSDKQLIYLDPLFLTKTNSAIGDHIMIGSASFEIAGTIIREPDALSAGFSLGIRALISRSAFDKTGLNKPGALLKWTYKIRLPDQKEIQNNLDSLVAQAQTLFPSEAWDIKTSMNAAPQLAKNSERLAQFLVLIGLSGLILGGLGIQQSIEAYLMNKKDDFSIFKALGATPNAIMGLALIQIIFFAIIGAGGGGLIGTILPPYLQSHLHLSALPLDMTWSFQAFIYSVTIGLSISLIFSILPLLRLRRTSVSELLRTHLSAFSMLNRQDIFIFICSICVFLIFIIFTSQDRGLTTYVIMGFGGLMLCLTLIDRLIGSILKYPFSSHSVFLRMALSNIKRMGSLRRAFIIACGFSFALLTAIGTIGATLKAQLSQQSLDEIPRYFIIDIQQIDLDPILAFIKNNTTFTSKYVPMMRGRVMMLHDQPINAEKINESARWVIEGDRGITYADELPDGSHLVEGTWWSHDYNQEPLISIEEGAAKGLGLHVNDYVTLNILGRNLRARIANIRSVNWQSFGINFVFVFSPNSFHNLPFTYLMTLNAPKEAPDTLSFARDFNKFFPDQTLIRVREALDAIAESLEQLNIAILGAMILIFGAANLAVLASISTNYRLRLYETSIIRALGATKRQLAFSILLESGLMSGLSLILGLTFGYGAAYALLISVFGFSQPQVNVLYIALALVLTLAMSIQIAFINLRKVLTRSPAQSLAEN